MARGEKRSSPSLPVLRDGDAWLPAGAEVGTVVPTGPSVLQVLTHTRFEALARDLTALVPAEGGTKQARLEPLVQSNKKTDGDQQSLVCWSKGSKQR